MAAAGSVSLTGRSCASVLTMAAAASDDVDMRKKSALFVLPCVMASLSLVWLRYGAVGAALAIPATARTAVTSLMICMVAVGLQMCLCVEK